MFTCSDHCHGFTHRPTVACVHVKHCSVPARYDSLLLNEECCQRNRTCFTNTIHRFLHIEQCGCCYSASPALNCVERHTFLHSVLPSRTLLCDHSRGFSNVHRVLDNLAPYRAMAKNERSSLLPSREGSHIVTACGLVNGTCKNIVFSTPAGIVRAFQEGYSFGISSTWSRAGNLMQDNFLIVTDSYHDVLYQYDLANRRRGIAVDAYSRLMYYTDGDTIFAMKLDGGYPFPLVNNTGTSRETLVLDPIRG
ncbi:hypothetical protein NP493_153g11043 [Ridgeia piscesae]|uniref:Uncharacterized protein n=1 Tax=Ridgeia piscesae TaxID=27915 RepID=A0AAD9UFT6_RIDPI|nr:hypothetical protein NP493_153g11043 [Ridgeia piscesae]